MKLAIILLLQILVSVQSLYCATPTTNPKVEDFSLSVNPASLDLGRANLGSVELTGIAEIQGQINSIQSNLNSLQDELNNPESNKDEIAEKIRVQTARVSLLENALKTNMPVVTLPNSALYSRVIFVKGVGTDAAKGKTVSITVQEVTTATCPTNEAGIVTAKSGSIYLDGSTFFITTGNYGTVTFTGTMTTSDGKTVTHSVKAVTFGQTKQQYLAAEEIRFNKTALEIDSQKDAFYAGVSLLIGSVALLVALATGLALVAAVILLSAAAALLIYAVYTWQSHHNEKNVENNVAAKSVAETLPSSGQ